MRVAVVAEQLLAPVPGGIGRYTAELVTALAQSSDGGDRLATWAAWHRDPSAAALRGVPGPKRLALPRRPLVAAWERGIGPSPRDADVVHALSLLMPPRRRAPTVVTIHDAVPWTHPETLTVRGVAWHRRMADRAARTADAVVVPTESVARQLLQRLPLLRAERLHVVGEGVAAVLLRIPTTDRTTRVARRYLLPDRFLLCVATVEPRKGLDVLVDALAHIGPNAPPLLVVGQPGWGGLDVDSMARSAGLAEGTVRSVGRVSDRDLAVLLRAATVLVAPSRAEGFGLPVVEAMAVGTAVICSDDPALVEVTGGASAVVPRGDSARLADAIRALLGDEAELDRMSAAGLRRAAAFTWSGVAERMWALYRDVAAQSNG